uniref:Uncharacterized protein n=1 Tax=Arundo donax TaxID=35708 RepID=A0A0A9F5U9_ARUDO
MEETLEALETGEKQLELGEAGGGRSQAAGLGDGDDDAMFRAEVTEGWLVSAVERGGAPDHG